jgi:hypothetical protein
MNPQYNKNKKVYKKIAMLEASQYLTSKHTAKL